MSCKTRVGAPLILSPASMSPLLILSNSANQTLNYPLVLVDRSNYSWTGVPTVRTAGFGVIVSHRIMATMAIHIH